MMWAESRLIVSSYRPPIPLIIINKNTLYFNIKIISHLIVR